MGLFADECVASCRTGAGRHIVRRDGKCGIVLRRATGEVTLEGKAVLPNGNGVIGSSYLKDERGKSDPSYQRPLNADDGERW